jgi:hypothetical protein
VSSPLAAKTAIVGRRDKKKKAFIVEKNGISIVKEIKEIKVNILTIAKARFGLHRADLKIDFSD